MFFWGVEVKGGENVLIKPGKDMLLHVSQACLGEIKKDKGSEFVRLFAKKDEKKFVLGILSAEKFPHLNFDVVFEDEFELSHDGKHGSVHFVGYKAPNPDVGDEDIDSDDSDGEPIPVRSLDNGKTETKEDKPAASNAVAAAKPESAAAKDKGKVKIVEPSKDVKLKEVDDDSDEDDSDEDDSEDDEGVKGESDDDDEDSSDEDEDEDESDEETPKKAESSKKRPAESSKKTPVPEKKAKFATPQKTDGKKPVPHVATPHPSKQAGKTSANSDKPKQQAPKSGGSFSCSPCNRTFGSEQALQSHSKAKHSAK